MAAPASAAPKEKFEVQKAPAEFSEARLVRFRYTATNKTDQLISSAPLWIWVPIAANSHQKLVELQTTLPGTLHVDGAGNQVLRVEAGPLAPYATAVLTVTAQVAMAPAPRPAKIEIKGGWLGAEPYVEADHEAIGKLAKQLTGAEGSAVDVPKATRRFFDWIRQNITDTGFSSRERGALWALENKAGDCSEMAFLFVALCRSVGIPARYAGGYVIEGNSLLTPEEYHNWAEFHDGKAWRVADPQRGQFDERPERYLTTRLFGSGTDPERRTDHRYRSESEQVELKMLGRQ
jgi:hypothetical protein